MSDAASSRPRLIAGSGRSGTTWVQDALAEANGLRPIFEPLHPAAWPAADAAAYRIALSDSRLPELRQVWDDVLDERFSATWTDYRIRPDRLAPRLADLASLSRLKKLVARWRKLAANRAKLGPRRRRSQWLIKAIRANLMVDWLTSTYGFRTVYIIRHPAAVVESQLRLGGSDWQPGKIAARVRVDALRGPIEEAGWLRQADAATTAEEKLTWDWCIDNFFRLRRENAPQAGDFFYEDLLDYGGDTWRRLAVALELDAVPDSAALARPSQQSRAGTVDGASQNTAGWMNRLSDQQQSLIQGVLDSAGVTMYRVDDNAPRRALRQAMQG